MLIGAFGSGLHSSREALTFSARAPRMTAATGSVFVVLGLFWAIRRRDRVWRDVSSIFLVLAVVVGVESAIGLLSVVSDGNTVATAHRWCAHCLVVMVWCLMGITTAAAVLSIRQRPITAISCGACVLVLFLLVLIESFTGYLPAGGRAVDAVAEEERNRFYLLHGLVMPGLIVATAVGGGIVLHRARRALASEASGPIRQIESENPYASPSGQ